MEKISFYLRYACGIYCIFNMYNGKKYIGSSVDMYNRMHEHLHLLRRGASHNQHLQNSWNKYGEEAFVFYPLEFCELDDRFEREQWYLSTLNPEYNLTENVIANFGHACTKECRKKISETLKKRYANGEISAYKQDHAKIACHVYNVHTFECIGIYDCVAEACRVLKTKKHQYNALVNRTYCIIKSSELENLLESVEDYISRNYKTTKSDQYKYLITEDNYGQLKYHLCRNEVVETTGVSLGCLNKHLNATKDDPYVTLNGYKIYTSNIYYPINAVQDEESPELSSGNIGETPEMDNTEISSESKKSEPSYSVGNETFQWHKQNLLESGCYSCELPKDCNGNCLRPKNIGPCPNYSGFWKRI